MAKIQAIIFFFFISTRLCSQNLIPNASFEDGSDLCDAFFNYSLMPKQATHWKCPNKGTSDIFSTKISTDCFSAMPHSTYRTVTPKDNVGSQLPRTGNRFAGFFTYTSNINIPYGPYREYLEIKLKEPLEIDSLYCVEMYVSLGGGSAFASNNIGMSFIERSDFVYENGALPYSPEVFNKDVILDSVGWCKISGTFKATNASKFVIIGNFSSDDETSILPFNNQRFENGFSDYAYYFVDDVSVEKMVKIATKFSFTGDLIVCESEKVKVNAGVDIEDTRWYTLDNQINPVATGANLEITVDETTSFHVIANYCNYQLEDTVTVIVHPRPKIYLGEDTTTCRGNPYILDVGKGYTSISFLK